MQTSFSVTGTRETSSQGQGLKGGEQNNDTKDDSFFSTVRERFQSSLSASSENRYNFITDVQFSATDDQWDAQIKRLRGANRPSLTFNRLNPVIKQILGEYRQRKLAIKVLPASGDATEDQAKILAGLVRNIEQTSDADSAYTNALECSSRGGFGYWRIITDYTGDDTFDQDILVRPIHNALTVYFDPSARLITREDAEWCFITEMIPKDQFKREYPEAKMQWFDGAGDNFMQDWSTMDDIRVAEYFVKEYYNATICSFSNGIVIEADKEEIEALAQIGIQLKKRRKAERVKIHWYKLTGAEILEEREYHWKYIPVIPCLGEEVNIEGKTYLRSAIFYAKDAQRMYNYNKTTATEVVALSPKAPIAITATQLEGFQDQWDNLNNSPQPYVPYNADPQAPGMPQRIAMSQQPIAELSMALNAADDIKATTGVYDASLGAQGNETSGVAIEARQNEGNTSTYIFIDNLKKAIEYGARVLLDIIPTVYDTERVVRILDLEGVPATEIVNQEIHYPMTGITQVLNSITVGKYDVVCTTGPNFASQKREAMQHLNELAKVYPQIMQLGGDLVIEAMDFPGAEKLAARIKRSIPPQITTDPESPEGQQAMQQAQQQQQQQQAIQQQMLQAHIQTEQGKQQAEQSKSQSAVVKSYAEVIKAKADVVKTALEVHKSANDAAHQAQDKQLGDYQPQVGTNSLGNQGLQQQQASQPQVANVNALGPVLQDLVQSHQKQKEAEMQQAHQAALQQQQQEAQRQQQEAEMQQQVLMQLLDQHRQAVEGHSQMLDQVVGNMAEGHQALAKAMEQNNNLLREHNKIASSPRKAVRDKDGRISGSTI